MGDASFFVIEHFTIIFNQNSSTVSHEMVMGLTVVCGAPWYLYNSLVSHKHKTTATAVMII